MTVIFEGPLCLKIQLSRNELKKYFISYEKIVFSDPGVKKTLLFLLEVASDNFEFEKNGSILIEVFPTPSGGCLLKFSCTPEPEVLAYPFNNRFKIKKTLYTFKFNSFDNLMQLSLAYIKKEKPNITKSDIYLMKKHYYLIIELLNTQTSMALLINEYSDFCAKGKCAAELVREYGKCIINKNALETVGKGIKEL